MIKKFSMVTSIAIIIALNALAVRCTAMEVQQQFSHGAGIYLPNV